MKVFAAVLLAILAISHAAVPKQKAVTASANERQMRFVGDLLASRLEAMSQQIREGGYDPFRSDGVDFGYALPVPVLFDAVAHVEDVSVLGASNIVINDISYGLLSNRLTFDIVLPRISCTVADAGLDMTILGTEIDAATSFNLAIVNARVTGIVQLNIGIISGIFVRDISIDFNLGGLEFHGSVNVMGHDLSSDFSTLINQQIPERIAALRTEINEMIEIIAWEIADSIL